MSQAKEERRASPRRTVVPRPAVDAPLRCRRRRRNNEGEREGVVAGFEVLAPKVVLERLAQDRRRLIRPAGSASRVAQSFEDDLDTANRLASRELDQAGAVDNRVLRLCRRGERRGVSARQSTACRRGNDARERLLRERAQSRCPVTGSQKLEARRSARAWRAVLSGRPGSVVESRGVVESVLQRCVEEDEGGSGGPTRRRVRGSKSGAGLTDCVLGGG